MAKQKRIPGARIVAHTTSKVRERDLLEKARMLMDDPELILPECTEDCSSCPFRKTRAHIERGRRYKDDLAMLTRLSRRGDKLARAYAATIGLVHEEKAPYLASVRYPAGTITYAQRGKTPREKLIGVQNFDSPKWRVLGVIDLVQRKGLHFYSYGDHFVCTGRRSHPPEEYVRLASEEAGATKLEGDAYVCPHSPESVDHIEFDWVNAGKKTILCDQCAVKAKNALRKLAEGMAVPNVLSEFDILLVRPLSTVSGKTDCAGLLDLEVSKEILSEYSEGKIGDHELIEKHMDEIKARLVGLDRRVYLRGNKCFGEDLQGFVADVTHDEMEQKALTGLLSDISHPVVADSSDSVNKIMTAYWADHGMDALRAVVSDELAQRHYRDDSEALRSPMKVIEGAVTEARHAEISASIPRYARLSEYGEFADKVVRAYKTKGLPGAMAVLETLKSNDHRMRSISNAFYLALGDMTKSWKFTDEEKQYGEHLKTYAEALLKSHDSEGHHASFETFLREAGCSEELRRS